MGTLGYGNIYGDDRILGRHPRIYHSYGRCGPRCPVLYGGHHLRQVCRGAGNIGDDEHLLCPRIHERLNFRANDNGEPSGTAGKPILGQINSNELTDILIIVVRYFGGIKLGTSGLIVAYKAAAAEAIANATIIEKTVDDDVYFAFEYPFMNDVMRIVKEEEPEILEQSYDMDCLMRLRIRRSMMPKLRARLEKVDSLRFIDEEE